MTDTLSGVTRNASGATLGGVTVEVFDTVSALLLGTAVSNGAGAYTVTLTGPSTACFAVAYKAGSPDVAGTTLNNLVSVSNLPAITIPSGVVTYFALNTADQTSDPFSGHNGTLAGTNTPTGLTAQIAQGLQFNSDGAATTSYMSFGSFQAPQTASSVSVWVRAPSFPNFGRIVEAGGAAAARYLRLYVGTNGSFAGELCQDSTNFIGRTTNASAISVNTWHHIVMTWSGGTTSAAVKLFIDNVQVDTFDNGSGSFSAPSAASVPWALGNSGSLAAADNLVGSVDDFRLYNRALSGADITAIYNAGVAGNP